MVRNLKRWRREAQSPDEQPGVDDAYLQLLDDVRTIFAERDQLQANTLEDEL